MEIFNPAEWARLKKIDIIQAKKTIEAMREHKNIVFAPFLSSPPQTRFKKPIKLSSKNINTLLGNGFTPGTVYLIYGAYATGKTQICFQVCVALYDLYKDLTTPISALFIDTEGTFRPERIEEIAISGYGLKAVSVLAHIRVLKTQSTDAIFTVLKKMDSEGLDKEIKLIIIDSLTKYVRVDLGDKMISNIQIREKLKRILVYLREITKKNNIVTILNSQVTGFIAEKNIFSERPIMEYVLNHYVDEVLYLTKEEEIRWIYLVNSPSHANQKVPFLISPSGIVDYEEK